MFPVYLILYLADKVDFFFFFCNADGSQLLQVAMIGKGHLDDVLPHSGLVGRKKNLFELFSQCSCLFICLL